MYKLLMSSFSCISKKIYTVYQNAMTCLSLITVIYLKCFERNPFQQFRIKTLVMYSFFFRSFDHLNITLTFKVECKPHVVSFNILRSDQFYLKSIQLKTLLDSNCGMTSDSWT